jgi:hypothetical protein
MQIGKWVFLNIQTPEIIVPSDSREVAIGVIGKMLKAGPIVKKSKRFTGNVYKLIKQFTSDEYGALAETEKVKLSKMPLYINPETFDELCYYEKVMTWNSKI